MRPLTQLRPYQVRADEFVRTRKRGMLWLDVGLGKTAALATAIEAGYRSTQRMRTLVFATKAIAQTVWVQELQQWEHLSWVAPLARTLTGMDAGKREQAIFGNGRTTRLDTINYEHVPWLLKQCEKRKMPLGALYDTIVCDEITKLKNPSGRWFRSMAKLVHPDHVQSFWGLTGSPAAEGYHQIWAPMYLVDYGHRLGYTMSQYLDRWFTLVGDRWYTQQNAKLEIQDVLKDVVMVMNAEDYNVLPEVLYNERHVPKPAHLSKMYATLEREMLLELERGDVIAANAGVLVGKCQQFTSGASYIVDELGQPTKQWEEIHQLKLDALESLFDELNGQNLLVAVQYRHEIERLLRRFPQAVHMNGDNVGRVSEKWNAGRIRMLIAHPLSCGHGLNLQAGGGDIFFLSLPYSLEQWQQMIGRLVRPGQQKHTVSVHAALMDGTIDHDTWRALQNKQQLQLALKRRMSNSTTEFSPALAALVGYGKNDET